MYLSTLDAKKAHSWQQEFKLSGKNASMDWIGGLSFYHNVEDQDSAGFANTATIDTQSLLSGGGANFATLFGALGAFGVPGVSATTAFPWREDTYNEVVTQSESLYGDTIWHLNPSTNLTAGLRWSKDQKYMTWDSPPRTSPELDSFLNSFGGLVPASLGGPISASTFPPNILFAAASQLAATPVNRTKSWTNFSPRLVLDHKVDNDTMVFASLSQGYQAGGFNIFTPPNPASTSASQRDPSFSPEKMTNFEAGTKMSFPQLKASMNASLFAYKFSNLQDINLAGAPGLRSRPITSSPVIKRRSGWTWTAASRRLKNVTLFGGFEFIDQTYTQYQQIGSSGVVSDLSGQPVGTPYFTGMAGMNVAWDTAGGHATWTFQGTHTSKMRRCNDDSLLACISAPNIETGAAILQNSTPASVGRPRTAHPYRVALLANNLFNQRYVQYLGGQLTVVGAPYATVTPPRFVGVEFMVSM